MKTLVKLVCHIFFFSIMFSCKKEFSCEECSEGNKPPIALAGLDQVITLPTDSVSLDGSLSSDPDGTISSFLWTKISGPASFSVANASVSKTVVINLIVAVYQFELKVKDKEGLSAKDTMQVMVIDPAHPNRPPVADASIDQTVTLPVNTALLDGSGSFDLDNNIASYAWTKISGPASFSILNPGNEITQLTNLVLGIYQFELKVTDAGLLFSKDTMQITVTHQTPPLPGSCGSITRPLISAHLIPIGTLSLARSGFSVAAT
ncbi:MAG: PKD domain-containing protein, partial [Chitinophagaceae bacterium]